MREIQLGSSLVPDLGVTVPGILDTIAAPLMLLNADCEIVLTNRAADEIIAAHEWLCAEENPCDWSCACEELRRTVRDLASDQPVASTTIRLNSPDNQQTLVVGCNPVAGQPLVMVTLVDPKQVHGPCAARLRSLFGLTDTESKVAALMAAGFDYREIAAQRELSVQTVRSYTKSIFRKLGVKSRTGVVTTIQSAMLPLSLVLHRH